VFARATKSKSAFFQAAWRGCRPFPGKDYYVILDFGGNLERLGNPMGYHDYDISEPRSRKGEEDAAMVKSCPECKAEVSIFAKVCDCGHEFGNGGDEQQEIFDPSLYTLKEWFDPIGCEQIQYLRLEIRRCYLENLSPDVAAEKFRLKFGFVAPRDWHRWAVFGKRATKADRQQYQTYLDLHGPHDWWRKVFFNMEFGRPDEGTPDFLAKWDQQWWEVLGVGKIDPKPVVKAAYVRLCKQWHPDVCSDKVNAKEQMQILNKAWYDYQKGA
jgi:hypothetical protein